MAVLPLDRYIPEPDIRERFETTVRAPANIVMDVATHFDLQSLRSVRAIFRLRERLLRSAPPAARVPQGLLDEMTNLGWGVLTHEPGVIVCGAHCQPWQADVTFTAIPADAFATWLAPEQVKIAWSLETDAIAPEVTRFGQETRAIATDVPARARFLRYWRWARFGIVAIRLLLMPAVRREAERRWAMERPEGG
jgi:hypothetical protein